MASRHKHRPILPAIPIPLRDNVPAASFKPRTAVPNSVAVPSLTKSIFKPSEMDLSQTDPDDLFVRFTVPEIRTIQAKLRAEADAKQAELRLMVGERYRDLLQASTSIISIAHSSQRVMGALAEMREAMAPDDSQRKPRSSSIRGKDDEHLKTLQSLSAHLKLLLDAPEHLWRLLEKKEHLQAAWLFLLARVVHRALITDDPEGGWENEGISVLTQFPLVQRQWDTVAQFRPQIAHRATQYLREASTSSESACSTVLTLHLLDSLPLSETLSTLLSQRSRSLNALLARNLDFHSPSRPGSPIFKSRRKNREVAGMLLSPPSATMPQWNRSRKDVVKDVRETVMELLDVIGGTMRIARDIFLPHGGEDRQKSLVERSLEDIQSDAPHSVFTTSSLLSTLPSSTHLLTLPHSILSYKPFIDLTSASTHVDPSVLDTKLSTWFDKAIQGFEGRMHAWFAGLETIREVWGVRRKVLERLKASQGLERHERVKVRSVLDEAVRDRACEVARAALDDVEERLDGALCKAVQDVREGGEDCRFDIMPSTFLLSAPSIPSLSQASNNQSPVISSFQRFKDALRQRANGRTPLVDRILSNVEDKAKQIEADLEVMNEVDEASWDLRDQVITIHQPVAQASLTRIAQLLGRLMTQEMTKFGNDINHSVDVVIFLGRISHDMLASTLVQSLHCRDEAWQAFREALNGLHDRSLKHWRTYAVSGALEECGSMLVVPKHPAIDSEFTWPSQPSPQLTNALLSLTSSIQRLGLSRAALSSHEVTIKALWGFRDAVGAEISMGSHIWGRELAQLLWDLTFLQQLPSARLGERVEAEDPLARALSRLWLQLRSSTPEEILTKLTVHVDHTIDQYLLRSQTLLASLLIPITPSQKAIENGNGVPLASTARMKPTVLLPFGAPESDQDFKPAMETVKPSTRFGLLLVGGTAVIQ